MKRNYWFNIKLGNDFEMGPGVYASWVNLVMDENGKILWENCSDDGTDRLIWTPEPDNIGFEFKDEHTRFVRENPGKVREAVLQSYEFGGYVHLWDRFSVYCHECYDEKGWPLGDGP